MVSENNEVSFCVVACLHFGGMLESWNSHKGTYAIFAHMNELGPDMLVLNGSEVDLALRVSDGISLDGQAHVRPSLASKEYVEFTRNVLDHLARSACRSIFYVPSENSVPNFLGENDPLFLVSNEAFLKRAQGRYYAFEQGDCFFICLDSESDPDVRGRISGDQLHFLQESVERARACRHVFCFIHLSAWRNDCRHKSQWFDVVHPLLKEAGVSHVFVACLHTYQHEYYDGVHYITSGGCGNSLDPPFPHFLYVKVVGETVRVNVLWSGWPLRFPMTLQLNPQVPIAFIAEGADVKIQPPAESEISAYQEAMRLRNFRDIEQAQEIWDGLRFFPCINPKKVRESMSSMKQYQSWFLAGTDSEDLERIRKRAFND